MTTPTGAPSNIAPKCEELAEARSQRGRVFTNIWISPVTRSLYRRRQRNWIGLCQRFLERDNTVIICGRRAEVLAEVDQEALDGKAVEWLDKVTDEEYGR